MADLGGRYLDGAIMTPTATIGTPDAVILFAGPRDHYDVGAEVFAALRTPIWLGAEHDRAATYEEWLLLDRRSGPRPADSLHALGIAVSATGIGAAELSATRHRHRGHPRPRSSPRSPSVSKPESIGDASAHRSLGGPSCRII